MRTLTEKLKLNKETLAWALYDFANSAFATTVMAAFFPIFFKKFWASDLPATESTYYLGLTMTLAGLGFALVAPFLGWLADRWRWTKRLLIIFALIGSLGSMGFALVEANQWLIALFVYCLAWIGFSGGNLLYDSLLVGITEKKERDWVSSVGYGLGYLGGGLLIVVNAVMVMKSDSFGISKELAFKASFVMVGIWWILFTLPLLFYVPEKQKTNLKEHNILETLKKILTNKELVIFLAAYFFYIDGVHTIFKMAVDFALSIGLQPPDLISAIILVQFVGFPMTFLVGYLARFFGAKKCIGFSILVYGLCCLFGPLVDSGPQFFVLAAVIGCVQGGIQALSRSFFSLYVPKDQASEYYGFFNMFGKFSAILGPFLVGVTSHWTGNSRYSLLAVLVLFILGGLLFSRVRMPSARGRAS
jgi:UMF1 family MFS transporter